MNLKIYLVAGLAAVGAFVAWKHFTAVRVVEVPIGGTVTKRASNNVETRPGVTHDLIGGISYGLTGENAITPADIQAMAT